MAEVLLRPLDVIKVMDIDQLTLYEEVLGARLLPEFIDLIVLNPDASEVKKGIPTPVVLAAVHAIIGDLDCVCNLVNIDILQITEVINKYYSYPDLELWLLRGPPRWPEFTLIEMKRGKQELETALQKHSKRTLWING